MSVKCSMCRQKLEPDEVCHAKNSPKILCEDCLWSNFYQCDRCQEYVALEELADYDIPDCYDYICNDCARNLLKQCADCSCFILPETAVVVDNKTYCPDCSEAHLYQCNLCKKYVKLEELADCDIPDSYDDICIDCARKRLKQCADCSCFILPETAVAVDNKTYCPNCSEAHLYQCDVCKKYVKLEELADYDIPDCCDYICNDCARKLLKQCADCSCFILPETAVVVDNKTYCPNCSEAHLYQCDVCKKYVKLEELADYDIPDCYDDICIDCARKLLKQCADCSCFILPETAVVVDNKTYCPDCSEAYLYQCDVCKKYVKFDKLEAYDIPDGYDNICRECFQKKFFLCSKCEEYYPADQAVTDEKGNKYCRFCGWEYAPIECFHCQTKVLGKDALIVRLPDGDIAVCAQCAQSHYRRCYGCKMLKPIKEAIKVETVWSCKECRGTVKKLLLEERRRQALAQSLNFLRGLQIARIILNAFRGKFW